MPKRSTRSSAERGTTLVELLVAMAVVLALMGTAYSLSLSSRRLYDADQARTRVNQSLRAGMEFLSADVRQAGERLGDDFPAIEIVNGGAGADRLIVRRSVTDTVLRLCRDVGGTDEDIYVGEPDSPPPLGCAFPDDDGDGWPDNMQRWRQHRLVSGGFVRGYIYDPVSKEGEFFDYVDEDADRFTVQAVAGTTWSRTYRYADQARLYLLEERAYEVQDRMLSVVVNRDGAPVHLVDAIDDFQARAILGDGSAMDTLTSADVWHDVQAIELDVRGRIDVRGRSVERKWTTRVMPRNVISR